MVAGDKQQMDTSHCDAQNRAEAREKLEGRVEKSCSCLLGDDVAREQGFTLEVVRDSCASST